MKRHVYLLLSIAVCISCKRAPQQQPARPAAGPQVRATVVNIRTSILPEKKTYDHALVIAGDRARSTGEQDVWRLYDVKARTVTYVDDLEKTIRTESLDDLVRQRRTRNAAPLPPHYQPVRLARTDEQRAFHGANARRVVIESGGYERELWLGEHPRIPRGLFAMMHVSDAPSSPLAPMMRAVDEALAGERGFPMLDRTTIPLREGSLVVERTDTAIGERQVPETLLTPPRDYKDLTPPPKTQ